MMCVCSIPTENSLTFGNDMAATSIVATFTVSCCVKIVMVSGMFVLSLFSAYTPTSSFDGSYFAVPQIRSIAPGIKIQGVEGENRSSPHHDVFGNKGKNTKSTITFLGEVGGGPSVIREFSREGL
jgi:hypothetical protein